jgi:hypothetical protein
MLDQGGQEVSAEKYEQEEPATPGRGLSQSIGGDDAGCALLKSGAEARRGPACRHI